MNDKRMIRFNDGSFMYLSDTFMNEVSDTWKKRAGVIDE